MAEQEPPVLPSRSAIMARIGPKNSKPEMVVRRLRHVRLHQRTSQGRTRRSGLRQSCSPPDAAAPDIVEAILAGRQPEKLTARALLEPFPAEWAEQQPRVSGLGG